MDKIDAIDGFCLNLFVFHYKHICIECKEFKPTQKKTNAFEKMFAASKEMSRSTLDMKEDPKDGKERLRNEILEYFIGKKCKFPKIP